MLSLLYKQSSIPTKPAPTDAHLSDNLPSRNLIILLILLLLYSCASQDRSSGMRFQPPTISSKRSENTPRFIGVNYIRNIKGNFSKPTGISVDADGILYVADSGKSVIYLLNSDGRILETIGRFGWRDGEFDNPADVALDSRFQLYIADSGNNRIQRYDLINKRFSVIAGENTDSSSESLIFSRPQSVTTDIRGYIYIADTWNHRILKVDPFGRLIMEIGNQQLRNPNGVAVDLNENIYISDSGNNRIHKLDFGGRTTFIQGQEGSAKSQFRNPLGITIDEPGYIYVVDNGNRRIQVFDPEGNYITGFGQPLLEDPADIAVDKNSHAYVTDTAAGDIKIFRIIYQMPEDAR